MATAAQARFRMRHCIHTTGSQNSPATANRPSDSASQKSSRPPTPVSFARSHPVTGWVTTAVAVKTMSASTTTAEVLAIEGGVPAEMGHQHEEGDAGTGAEDRHRAEHMQVFENEIGHGQSVSAGSVSPAARRSARGSADQCRKCRMPVKTMAMPCAVRRGDDLGVAHRAAGLDHRGRPRLDRRDQAVGEGEEGVRGDDRAVRQRRERMRVAGGKARDDLGAGALGQQGARRVLGLARGDARGVDPAHLAGADADAGEDPWHRRWRSTSHAWRRGRQSAGPPSRRRSARASSPP